MTDPQTEPPAELVEAVRTAVHDAWCDVECSVPGHDTEPLDEPQARAAIAAVRAYDAEREPHAQVVTCDHGYRHTRLTYPNGRPGAVLVAVEVLEEMFERREPCPHLRSVGDPVCLWCGQVTE